MKIEQDRKRAERVARALAGDRGALDSLCASWWARMVAQVQQLFPGLDDPEDMVQSFWLRLDLDGLFR